MTAGYVCVAGPILLDASEKGGAPEQEPYGEYKSESR
jgi:hypothetical protein